MNPAFRFRSAGLTHVGCIRSVNEDALVMRDQDGVWLVADGMGGHANGQWASSTIGEAVRGAKLSGDWEQDTAALAAAIHAANHTIHQEALRAGEPMGSTAVLFFVCGRRFTCLWAGDSRAYLLRGGVMLQLTHDHTQVQEMVARGLLTPQEARRHPMGHVLSRAVGVQPTLELDAVTDDLQPRDCVFLCSDGLHGQVNGAEIQERLSAFDPVSACGRLLDLALSRGAPDNVTVAAVALEELTALSFSDPV